MISDGCNYGVRPGKVKRCHLVAQVGSRESTMNGIILLKPQGQLHGICSIQQDHTR